MLEQDQKKKFYRPADFTTSILSKPKFDLRFQRISESLINKGFFSMISKVNELRKQTNLGVPTDLQKLEQELPIRQPDFTNQTDQIKYTWIGHSTAVISFGQDANFLIDPVLSERASPFQFAGPKRYRKPAATVKQFPKIDAVLISHDHYDHMDAQTIKQLYQSNEDIIFVAGLGSQDVFPKNAFVKTLDWTRSYNFTVRGKVFKVTFVPVCHWGKRWLNDTNQRLWGGFVIQTPTQQKIFYSGDTAYCEIFEELGEEFGGFDLAILPIGAYQPRHFLMSQHVNPEESVQIHKEIHSKKSVGVHWGTFPLGYEHYLAPRADLEKAKKQKNVKEEEFVTIDHGASLVIKYQKSELI